MGFHIWEIIKATTMVSLQYYVKPIGQVEARVPIHKNIYVKSLINSRNHGFFTINRRESLYWKNC